MERIWAQPGPCFKLSILNPQPYTPCNFSDICGLYVAGAPTAQSHIVVSYKTTRVGTLLVKERPTCGERMRCFENTSWLDTALLPANENAALASTTYSSSTWTFADFPVIPSKPRFTAIQRTSCGPGNPPPQACMLHGLNVRAAPQC